MSNRDKIVKSALIAILASAATSIAVHNENAYAATSMEKCYGIAKAGMNDCQTANSSCSGSSTKDRQADAYIFLPKGMCQNIVGGQLHKETTSLADQAEITTFTLDPLHTYVLWHINHFGFSNPSGKWMANGTLVLNKDHPQQDKVNVTINVADIITGIPELDKHLKGENFFDVTKFPEATFVSNKVIITGKNVARVEGTLTLHGVSKNIMLNVRLNKVGINPINNKMTVGFSATALLKRSDFGMTSFLPGLGNEVNLNIEVEAYIK